MAKSIKLKDNTYWDINSIKQDMILTRPNGTITLSGYQDVPLVAKYNIGNSFKIVNGAIQCLKTGYIEISGTISFTSVKGAGVKWLEVRKKSDNGAILLAPHYCTDRSIISASPIIYDVEAGETLVFKVDALAGDVLRGDVEYTRVFVKYLPTR